VLEVDFTSSFRSAFSHEFRFLTPENDKWLRRLLQHPSTFFTRERDRGVLHDGRRVDQNRTSAGKRRHSPLAIRIAVKTLPARTLAFASSMPTQRDRCETARRRPSQARQGLRRAASDLETDFSPRTPRSPPRRGQVYAASVVEMVLIQILEKPARPRRMANDLQVVDVPLQVVRAPRRSSPARHYTICGWNEISIGLPNRSSMCSSVCRRRPRLAIAYDAAAARRRGPLIDRGDFLAAGASFNHLLRTIHGGRRYLQTLDLSGFAIDS